MIVSSYNGYYPFTDGPDIVMLSPSNDSYTIEEHSNLSEVTCSAKCVPACSLSWIGPDGQNVSSGEEVLSLLNISRKQSGNYTCSAVNTVTLQTKNATFNIDVTCKYLKSFM